MRSYPSKYHHNVVKRRKKRFGLFDIAVQRAMSDALYEKLIDECWEEFVAVFDAPKVKEARRKFLRAFSAELAKRDGKEGR